MVGKLALIQLWQKNMLALFATGLDAVGKTSTLYRLKCGEIVTTIPTIGNDSRTAMAYLEVTNIIMYYVYVWCCQAVMKR